MSLTVVSLFAGVGGFDLAFERAGAKVVAAVEIDAPARTVLAKRFPNTALFNDVTEVSGDDLRAVGFVPERGILTGGFPCQDLSVAGRRSGLAGARSGLFWEVVRLLDELRPAWFVLENVPGLLSSVCDPQCPGGCMATHGGAMGTVLGALGNVGYGVAYRVLDAKYFGVPQQRRRVFIVGHLGEPFGAAAEVLFESESSRRDSAPRRTSWPRIAPGATWGTGDVGVDLYNGSINGAVSHTVRVGNGNAMGAVPAVMSSTEPNHTPLTQVGRREWVAALTADADGVGTCGADDNQAQAGHIITYAPEVARTLTAGMSSPGVSAPGRRQDDDDNIVVNAITTSMERYDDNMVGGGHLIVSDPNDRVVAPLLSARRGVPSTDEANQLVVAFGENQRGEIFTQPGGKPGQGYPAILNDTIVRRLTPLECERLQGFPDYHTEGQSDAQRYRQCGNAVAVPVVEWIARRLIAIDEVVG